MKTGPSPAPVEVGALSCLEHLAAMLTRMSERMTAESDGSLAQEVVEATCELLPAVRWCSITVARPHGFTSLAASNGLARRVDEVQYEARSGPCVDAAVDDNIYLSDDLTQETRWPDFAREASASGVRSVLAYRLKLVGNEKADAALNLYADVADAFDEGARWTGMMLATQAAFGVSVELSNTTAQNLRRALQSNRRIGMATGILMSLSKVTSDEAFNLLRMASQHSNRKLANIAEEVIETGALPLPMSPQQAATPAGGPDADITSAR